MKIDLFKEVENLFFNEDLKKEIYKLLCEEENLKNINIKDWRNFLKIISLWKEEYIFKSSSISVYGFLTWTLDISISEFNLSDEKICNIKKYLLKLLLVDEFHDYNESDIYFRKDDTLDEILSEYAEDIEFNKCYKISYEDFINDLENYYNGSRNRFQSYERRYESYKTNKNNNSETLKEFEKGYKSYIEKYEKYLKIIEYFKNNFKDCEIVRINKLGEYESKWRTEICFYFVLKEKNLYLLTFSDFA